MGVHDLLEGSDIYCALSLGNVSLCRFELLLEFVRLSLIITCII
jgi:hypothetical protein